MENFVFALNASMPVFLVILAGWFLRRIGLLNSTFCKTADAYVFKCALPVSLFLSVSGMDIYTDFDPRFCLFCFLVTTVMFFGVWGLTWRFMKEKRYIGAFAQASVRSSAAILGLALATNIYGNTGLVPIMIVSAVPFFNIYAVMILSFSPQVDAEGQLITGGEQHSAIRRAVINTAKNPIIIGILLGLPFALLRWQMPAIPLKALQEIGKTATPIALLVVGAGFSGKDAMVRLKPAIAASVIKLLLLPLLFLPVAMLLGFTQSAMIAILIMVGSPTTVTCAVMAGNMKGDVPLSSNVVVITTLFSSVTLTFWLYVLKAGGFI